MAETTADPPRDHRPARLQAHLRGPSQAAAHRRGGHRSGPAAGHPGRPRHPALGGDRGAQGVRRADPDPGGAHAPGRGRHRRAPPAELRLHGHARLEARQPRHPVGGPAHRARHALRRPGDRQRQHLRAERAHRPRGHRPVRDRQERGRGRAHRGRRRARAAGAHAADARADRGRARAPTSASSPSGARTPRASAGTARAPGATGCCRRTTSSPAWASSPTTTPT